MPGSNIEKNNARLVYNPSLKRLETRFVGDIEDEWNKVINGTEDQGASTYYKKEGGVIKFQLGGNFESTADLIRKADEFNAAESGKTYEQYKRDNKKISDNWSAADKARLAGIGLDLASLGFANFAPGYGTIGSAATGVASSISNLIADVKEDGYQGKDI
jgi:hypothetical protein